MRRGKQDETERNVGVAFPLLNCASRICFEESPETAYRKIPQGKANSQDHCISSQPLECIATSGFNSVFTPLRAQLQSLTERQFGLWRYALVI